MRLLVSIGSLGLLAACAGEGSDIGPRLPRIPDESCRVVLLDDQCRGVVSANVTISGTTLRANTGRNGRGDFLASPRGRLLLRADGSNGAAVNGDRLATFQVATTIAERDVPTPIYLPDLPDTPASASVTLTAGTQATPTTVTSAGGSDLVIPSGVSVGTPDAAPTINIRLGEVSPGHVPGDLPAPPSGTTLFGRGVFVHPVDVTFSTAVDLDVNDDLTLGASPASLYRLDDSTGEWAMVAVTVTSAGGRLTATGGVSSGGFYCFGAPTTAATVTGRVLDVDGGVVPDVIIRVDHLVTRTFGDGRFSIDGVPATNADGSARNAAVELFAGGSWLPVVRKLAVAVTGGTNDLGDLELDTIPCGNIRVQQVVRARADPLQPARLSSLLGDVALHSTSDANGQDLFEDVPFGFFGFQEGRIRFPTEVFYGQTVAFMEPGRRWQDGFQFLFDREWFLGTRSTRAYICDAIGGGPVLDAVLVQGNEPEVGSLGFTREAGQLFGDRGFFGRATATCRTERDGRSITHALSFSLPNSDLLEFPMQRVLRTPLGMFDRHGLFAGTVTNFDGSRMHAVRSTRRIRRQEWWDDLVEGRPLQSSLPVDVVPATANAAAYRAGVATNGGNIAVIEFAQPGGKGQLLKAGLLVDVVPTEGEVTNTNIALDLESTATFQVAGALTNVDPMVDANNLQVSLALDQTDGRMVEVARDISGSYVVAGDDVTFTLPPLTGDIASNRWLALLRGETSSGGITSKWAGLWTLADPVTTDIRVPPFPILTGPTTGATVSADGFGVFYVIPSTALFGTLELREDTGTELLLWETVVRRSETSFDYVKLPSDATSPLVAGRTYELTVSAYYGGDDVVSGDPLGDRLSFRQSIGPVEQGVTSVTRRTITITAN